MLPQSSQLHGPSPSCNSCCIFVLWQCDTPAETERKIVIKNEYIIVQFFSLRVCLPMRVSMRISFRVSIYVAFAFAQVWTREHVTGLADYLRHVIIRYG